MTTRVISDAKVTTHVARVLMKLNLADHVQAVIFAYETGLVQPGETAPWASLPWRSPGASQECTRPSMKGLS